MNSAGKPGTSNQTPNATTTGSNQNASTSKQEQNESPSSTKHNSDKKKELDLIDVVNQLQNKLIASGHVLNVSLPQIVVVGAQSAGKSSVLEGFVRREFLPRGKGTVTRRPTYVQMFPDEEEYVIFAHKPDVKFTDFNLVREEIENETKKHPGPTGFSSDPISLKIYSPSVLKLTVVDLPGIIKCVEEGQSQAGIQEVRKMILNYIRPQESLILAVTAATQEIVTSDALEIAREVDPKRERTIGVLSKLDMIIETDYCDVLENRKIYLHKGHVGVINRNEAEIKERKDFNYILQKEKEYFANHPAYGRMKDKCGIPYLIRVLQKHLRAHIKQFLPQVRVDVSQKLSEHQKELRNFERKMGDSIGMSRSCTKQYYVVKLLQNFIEDINIKVFGQNERVEINTFSAGAIIHYKFATDVKKLLSLQLLPDENQTSIIICNMLGLRTSIAIPTTALDALNRILLNQYKGPMEESVKCIRQVLEAAIEESAKKMDRYNSLKNEVLFKIRTCIEKEAENTIDRLISHIDASMFFINYNYPDFDPAACQPMAPPTGPIKLWENAAPEDDVIEEKGDGANAAPSLLNTDRMIQLLKQNESNQKNVQYASTLMMKCLEHVQKQMGDIAIKYIIFFLVKKVLDFIKTDLLPTLMESSNFASLTEDCEADFRWKEETESMCRILQEALDAIQDF